MEELARVLSANIRKARAEHGLTQAEVAERVGLSVELYGRMERGLMLPSAKTFKALYLTLGVSLDNIETDRPPPRPRLRVVREDE